MKKIKNFIFVVICLFLFPMVTKAVLIGNFDYGGKVVIKWVDAHNKLNMRPDEITIPLKAEVWNGGITKTVQYELTLNKKDAQITENGIYTYWTFNISFPFNSTDEDLKFEFDSSVDFNLPRSYIKSFDTFERGQLGCVTPTFCYDFDSNVLEITLVKDVSRDIPVKEIFNDDNGRDNYRYIYFYMKGINTIDTYYSVDGTVKLKVDEYSYIMELVKYLVTDVTDNELNKIEYEYGILDEVKNLTDDTYKYTVEEDEDGNIIYTINHKAERIKVPIKVNWLDDNNLYQKRPSKLLIKTINQYDEVEEEINLDKWQTDLELFKNIKYSFGKEQIEYNLKLDNTKDYEYEVIGDNSGFTINAKYIGDKTIPISKVVDKKEDVNTNDVLPPQTGDDINVFISLILISISCIFISYRQLNKKI